MPTPRKYVTQSGTPTWRVRFRDGTVQTTETFDTWLDADRFCHAVKAHGGTKARQLLALPDTDPANTPTVGDLAEAFFTWKQGRPKSDRTVIDYRRDYRNWIGPVFGDRIASTITERDVQRWVDAMTNGTMGRKKASPKSVAERHAQLGAIFRWASSRTQLLLDPPHDPTTETDLPDKNTGNPPGLRPNEWLALYAALRQIDGDGADLAEFLLSTGFRFSEAAACSALAFEDYGDHMMVTMNQVIRRNAQNQFVVVADAKSQAGFGRRVLIDRDASAVVRRRLDRTEGNGLVFTTARGAQWRQSDYYERVWKPAVEVSGLAARGPTPHWLRHTHVYWQLSTGQCDLVGLSRRLGHKSISTTVNVYGRAVEGIGVGAVDAFGALKSGAMALGGARRELDT